MSDLSRSGEDFDAEVVEADRGGLVVDVGPRGFDPLLQLASVGSLSALGAGGPPDVLRARVGKRLPLKVIEADQRRDRLILSEKAAAREVRRRRKEEASRRLSEVRCSTGQSRMSQPSGSSSMSESPGGLVHRSEITWDKGLERHRGFDPRPRHRVPSSGIPDRGSTSGGSCACPCGGYRRRTAAFVALDTSSLSKCHVRNADSQVMRTYNRNQMTPGPIYL